MSHEGAELGYVELVAIGFVENLLSGVEGVCDEPCRCQLEAYPLKAGKAELGAGDMVAVWIEGGYLRHRTAYALRACGSVSLSCCW